MFTDEISKTVAEYLSKYINAKDLDERINILNNLSAYLIGVMDRETNLDRRDKLILFNLTILISRDIYLDIKNLNERTSNLEKFLLERVETFNKIINNLDQRMNSLEKELDIKKNNR